MRSRNANARVDEGEFACAPACEGFTSDGVRSARGEQAASAKVAKIARRRETTLLKTAGDRLYFAGGLVDCALDRRAVSAFHRFGQRRKSDFGIPLAAVEEQV